MKTILPRLVAATALAFAATDCFADGPVNYWNSRNGTYVSAADAFRLDDGSVAAWTNGNVLIAGSSGYPSWAGSSFNARTTTFDRDVDAYAVRYFSGSATWKGEGALSIGAGGYDTTKSPATEAEVFSFDIHTFAMAGLRLTASQTWTEWSGDLRFSCPVTAAEGVTAWTISTPKTPKWGSKRCQTRIASKCDLSGVMVTLQGYQGLMLETEGAELNADVLRIEGGLARLVYAEAAGNVVDSRYAKSLVLSSGGSPAIVDEAGACVGSVVYGLDGIRVASGESAIGDGQTYSVKDGGDLPVAVEADATLTVASRPTAGRLVVTGAGSVALSSPPDASLDFSGFSGTVQLTGHGKIASLGGTFPKAAAVSLSDVVLRIDNVAGYAKPLSILGISRVALPRTADWPEGMSVAASDGTAIYLPSGAAVDQERISGGVVRAVGRGMATEVDTTVSKGEELVICGDGFASGATLTVSGGVLVMPFDVEIGSAVHFTTHSSLSVSDRATATAIGAWEWNKDAVAWITISNGNYAVGSEICNGRLLLMNAGNVVNGKIRWIGGDLVFSGTDCNWSIASGSIDFWSSGGNYFGYRYMGILDGAQLVFEDSGSFADPASAAGGLDVRGTGADMPCLEIGAGALLELGENRSLVLGTSSWRCHPTVKVSGGTLRLKGPDGAFQTGGLTAAALTDETTSGSVQVDIVVTDGGVIETDRVFSAYPVQHRGDAGEWTASWDGTTLSFPAFTAGAFLTLDGGTWRAGGKFGLSPLAENSNTARSRNVLFAGVTNALSDASTLPDYTAEIMVTIGEGGGTFDISQAQAGVTAVTNTILGAEVPAANVTGGLAPTLGPRWTLDGTLTVKGRGDQEFVVNGLDAAALKRLRADGATLKVVSCGEAEIEEMTLGAPAGGGIVVESEEDPSQHFAVSVASLSVAAGGCLDASFFDVGNTTVGDVAFGEGSALYARGNPVPLLSVTGAATLSAQMGYWADASDGGTALAAGSVVVPEGGVSWTRSDGSRRRSVRVTGTSIEMNPPGTVIVVR